ncbi:hypothetical protein [Klebsiella sp. PL-2018]|uniref:hypothetical protein n=1 Tax=Klebsiella sp. PL-2018 TaxID=2851540 RepID=UPI001C22BC32|nr:hypothetical protein [Klebsiella sp. PL-2018]QXD00418.1 hypothetical protein MKleb_4917 [Klebsiella sp. PL-2018]
MFSAKDILEHRKVHGIKNGVQDMGTEEYRDALKKDAVVMINSRGSIVESFSGLTLAADGEQLDLLIAHMESMRKELTDYNMWDLLNK